MSKQAVRGRAAPSPTGRVQIGNIRTFIFNDLFLRQQNGVNILRVEDTDERRRVDQGLEGIIEVLKLYGIQFQEGPHVGGDYGPYIQSERGDIYRKYAKQLVDQGDAYYCFCSADRLAKVREEKMANKEKPGYDRACRGIDPVEAAKRVENGEPHVVRLKYPLEGKVEFEDIVFGKLKFDNSDMEDIVILKSDGLPPYNFAVVVDDHLMGVTHAVRAREYLSEIPKNMYLYKVLGWEPVKYVHAPEVLSADGRGKLSKRRGAKPAVFYLRKGYLPEAMRNYLVLLGWSPRPEDAKEDEVYTEDELIQLFSLDRISKSPARYDEKKMDYINGKHIRMMDLDTFADRVIDWADNLVLAEFISDQFEDHPQEEVQLQEDVRRLLPLWKEDINMFKQALELVHERIKVLSEVPTLIEFMYVDTLTWTDDDWKLKDRTKQDMVNALKGVLPKLDAIFSGNNFDHDMWENTVRGYADEIDWKHGELFMGIRSATTGRLHSPPLLECFQVMGWDKAHMFIEQAIVWLGK